MIYLRFTLRLLALAALVGGPATGAVAAGVAAVCDPALLDATDNRLAYRQRGDRCEGIYAQQVGALTLEVRSLVASFAPFDPAVDGELLLAWQAPPGAGGEARVRAFSFRPRTYFRMDTAAPADRGAYRWPGDVLAAVGLGREELGVVAWLELPFPKGVTREVYLPLRVATPRAPAPAAGEYLVTVLPSKRAVEVRVTLERLDAAGDAVAATLRRAEELGYGYYPSGKPTVFSTGPLGPAGFYRVEVAAVAAAAEDPFVLELYLYHPGD